MNNSNAPAVGMFEHMMTTPDAAEHKSLFPKSLYDLSAVQLYTLVHMMRNTLET
jgi:hypothetical protein